MMLSPHRVITMRVSKEKERPPLSGNAQVGDTGGGREATGSNEEVGKETGRTRDGVSGEVKDGGGVGGNNDELTALSRFSSLRFDKDVSEYLRVGKRTPVGEVFGEGRSKGGEEQNDRESRNPVKAGRIREVPP
jgi:hypothetical protein